MIHFTIPAMQYFAGRKGALRLQENVIDGFYVLGKRPNWGRLERYNAWKDHVRGAALDVGLKLPLEATKAKPLYVSVVSWFASGVHPDPENVRKGVIDALVQNLESGRRGSDKYIGGFCEIPRYDKARPRVEVWIMTREEWLAGWAVAKDLVRALVQDWPAAASLLRG